LAIARHLQDLRAEGDTQVLLALDAENQEDIESASASLRRAEEIARALKDRDLQARACRGRASLEFKAGRFAAATTLYLRAAQLLGEQAYQQLAETLGGALLSAASRGRLDEQTLEQMIEVSARIAGDKNLVAELSGTLPALSEKGADRDVARLAAVALALALRLLLAREGDAEPFVHVGGAAARWIASEHRRETMLHDELHDICGQDAASEIMKLLDGAVQAISDKRDQDGTRHPPSAVPAAA
jgi:hypothetical protein